MSFTVSSKNANKPYHPSCDFVLVIDISGSMNAEHKLAYVKATIAFLVNELEENHRIAIITFNAEVQTLTELIDANNPLIPLTKENKKKIMTLVDEVVAEGATNIADALTAAFAILKSRKNPDNNRISSILFLTDGYATVNKVGNELVAHCYNIKNDPHFPTGLSLSTYGFGVDHDSRLLRLISKITVSGIYYYIQSKEMIGYAFAQAIDRVLSTTVYGVHLNLVAKKSCRVVSHCHPPELVDVVEENKVISFHLGSFSSEESRTLLVRISLNKVNEGTHHILEAFLHYTDATNFTKQILAKDIIIDRDESIVINDPDKAHFPLASAPIELHRCFWKYLVSRAINEAVAAVEGDNLFALKELNKVINLLRDGSDQIVNDDIGKVYLYLLEQIRLGFECRETVSQAIHYANAYLSMLRMERSVAEDRLTNMQDIVKEFQNTMAKRCRLSDRSRLLQATYQTVKYLTKNVDEELPRYIENYLK